jgi:hypothetical protein
MAVFRGGVKVGKFDVRTGLSQQRGRGILRQLGILEKKDTRVKSKGGEIDLIRTIVGRGEGFQMPVNFKVRFNCPRGIDDPNLLEGGLSKVKPNGLEHKTHKLNRSHSVFGRGSIVEVFNNAKQAASTQYDNGMSVSQARRSDTKLDLYCSKVSIPSKAINIGLYRNYGPAYPYPQSIQYGTLSTTFYCDGAMHIKTFFDAWQKLIYNDITGNFNYYKEYISEFEVFTRSTVVGKEMTPVSANNEGKKKNKFQELAADVQGGIKSFTKKFNEVTGVPNPPSDKPNNPIQTPSFTETYGVKVFECWPQEVGEIALGHDMTDQIATFDVTWAYTRWNPFKLGDLTIPGRGKVNLSVGEFRNEKDGFPFIEDLPPELSGPLTGAINQAVTTSPASRASVLFG